MTTKLTKEKLAELSQRMMNHDVDENDVAIVKVTAAELEELIDAATLLRTIKVILGQEEW